MELQDIDDKAVSSRLVVSEIATIKALTQPTAPSLVGCWRLPAAPSRRHCQILSESDSVIEVDGRNILQIEASSQLARYWAAVIVNIRWELARWKEVGSK